MRKVYSPKYNNATNKGVFGKLFKSELAKVARLLKKTSLNNLNS